MTSQRDIVRQSLDRDKQKDVTPRRPPGDRRTHHRAGDVLDAEGHSGQCVYCGHVMLDLKAELRMACPALLGDPLPTHAVRVGVDRQGWRARLANVERLLSEIELHGGVEHVRDIRTDGAVRLRAALVEVRSMIDDIGTEQ